MTAVKRLLAGLLFGLILLYNGGVARAESAKAGILMEMETGRVLWEKNAHEALPMASTTKVMTALLALEYAALSDKVTAGENAFGVPGTSIYLAQGETLTMEEMLLGLMLCSGNDAAVAIAEHVAGSVDGFCRLMTQRAAQIGCENTLFSTPHGLPAQNHHTTAYDLALICREALKSPAFRQIVSTQRASIPWAGHPQNRILNNKNSLLSTYPGAIGIKTGYTKAAGRCLCFAAERDGMTLVGCVLNDPNWFQDAAALMDTGFADYQMVRLFGENEVVETLPVANGERASLPILAGRALEAPMRRGTYPTLTFSLPAGLEAPVEKGTHVGTATLSDEGRVLLTVPLYAGENVNRQSFRFHITRIFTNWHSR